MDQEQRSEIGHFIAGSEYPEYSTFNEHRVILIFKDGHTAVGASANSQEEAESTAYVAARNYCQHKGWIKTNAVINDLVASRFVKVDLNGMASGYGLTYKNPIMDFFHYSHLPAHLQSVSKPLGDVAYLMDKSLPDGAEKATGLRKLLEAKDCFVRCAVADKDLKIDLGQMSDGYHTFNEMYAHRMVLFAVVCHANLPHAWKSKLHHDGTMSENYFIVGLNTPEGQFTYHYHMDCWNLFNVQVLDNAPEFDGHTANDVTRLHSLNGDSHA